MTDKCVKWYPWTLTFRIFKSPGKQLNADFHKACLFIANDHNSASFLNIHQYQTYSIMPTASAQDFDFPVFFWGIFTKSLQFYVRHFVNIIVVSIITFIPFILLISLSTRALPLIEFFHGSFLDLIVILMLPTIYLHGRVFPLATIQLFLQRFFASAVAISCIQFAVMIFPMFFGQTNSILFVIGMIPYFYLLFAGFFLIIENSSQLISIKSNIINSVRFVKSRFFNVFVHFFLISLIISLPISLYLLFFAIGQPEFDSLFEVMQKQPENTELFRQHYSALIEKVTSHDFLWASLVCHVIFRPIKSLFLSFLFLGILFRLNPQPVKSFLGFSEPEDSQDDSASFNEDLENNNTIH